LRNWIPAFAGMTLIACASAPPVVPQVLVPPPATPRAGFYIERIQAQSREGNAAAQERNDVYARALTANLREALREAGKVLAAPPADSIRAKLYFAYEPVTTTGQGRRRAEAFVEVRLELVDAAGAVLYVTYLRAVAPRGPRSAGWSAEADQLARDALSQAARDFVSRL
jgi:hypothetical protein